MAEVKPWMVPIARGAGDSDMPECGDFKRGSCYRATCKFMHGGKPASEHFAAAGGIPGSTNNGVAGLPTPRAAGSFQGPSDMDTSLYDPNTGFGLFGTSAFGTRYGQIGPLAKIDNVRPLCMDFFKQGFCNRRGPHNQGCLFRHDEVEGKGKVVDEQALANRVDEDVVNLFAAEAQGRLVVEGKVAYSDLEEDAIAWAKHKEVQVVAAAAAKEAAKEAAKNAPAPAPAAQAAPPAAAAAEAPPPAGWKATKAPDGRTYYYHAETKKTQWTRPDGPPAAAAPALPGGWKEAKAPDGRTYYYVPGSSTTSWTRPTESPPGYVPPAGAPAAAAPAAAAPAAAPAAAAEGGAEGGANGEAAATNGAAEGGDEEEDRAAKRPKVDG